MTKQESADAIKLDEMGLPIGRWLTFEEETAYMVNYPRSVALIWGGHKDSRRRASAGMVLSGLESIAPLRHLIRRGELQMARLHHVVTRTFHAVFRSGRVT